MEQDAECDGMPTFSSIDEEYTIDDIDSTTFDFITEYIYLEKVEPTQDVVLPLLKAAHILKIESLKKLCINWMKENSNQMSDKDVVEILNFTHENTEYKDLNRFFLPKYIDNSWPKIDNLPQFADIFKKILLPEGAYSYENGVYLFDKVDREAFKMFTDYIYFNEEYLQKNNLARMLEVSNTFKVEKLIKTCVKDLLWSRKYMSPADVKKVLDVTVKNVEYYQVPNAVYLAEHMKQWPQVDIDLFCSISYDCLEDMLVSDNLHFDDPRVLLDIFSKWVMHDVKNRYHLVPRIALAISRNREADFDNYSFAVPSNWKDCSEDFVKDKIQEVLSSTSILPSKSLSEDEILKRKLELPVFITSHKGRSFSVLNADWDEIVSFRLGENVRETDRFRCTFRYPMSATIMNDNLFILCTMCDSCFFYVYNFPTEKLFSLASDPRIWENVDRLWPPAACRPPYTLLNCCNDIYCCCENGHILKYSFDFNRWMKIPAPEPPISGIRYASDGDKLFRILKLPPTDTEDNYTIDVYDFQQNLWVSSSLPRLTRPCSRIYPSFFDDTKLHEFVFFKNRGLAALFREFLYILDQETQIWREMRSLPGKTPSIFVDHEIINTNEANEILYVNVIEEKLYKFSSANKSWELRKEWPRKGLGNLPYEHIIGIHNPKPSRLFLSRNFSTMAPRSRPFFSRAVRLGGMLRGARFQTAPARGLFSLGLLARSFF